jgi:fructoselysine-6-P-deglycase FrlB-like protein
MNPDAFLADVLDEPQSLARVLDHADVAPLTDRIARARLVVFLGMGSSRFAALTAAAHLRANGVPAIVEYASTDLATRPGADVLAVGISATGNSAETVTALQRHHGISQTVAITNHPDGGRLGAVADAVLPLHAGTETGGVACKTFQATLAVLLLAAGVTKDQLVPAVAAQQGLIDSRDTWLDELLARLEGHGPAAAPPPPPSVYTIAPASRISSALQSALMFREGPRIPADSAETGDWSHVDVYLTKYPNYTALIFPGSPYDAEALDWIAQRDATIISVGRPTTPNAAQHIPYDNAGDPLVATLVDVTVAELTAATWWIRRTAASAMP